MYLCLVFSLASYKTAQLRCRIVDHSREEKWRRNKAVGLDSEALVKGSLASMKGENRFVWMFACISKMVKDPRRVRASVIEKKEKSLAIEGLSLPAKPTIKMLILFSCNSIPPC